MIPLRGYGQVPSGNSYVLAGHSEATACSAQAFWGTVSTDPLVATPLFFFFFFGTQNIWDKGSGAQGTSRGFNQLNKGHEAVRVTLPYRIFWKNAEPWCANLPLDWILTKCPKSSVRTYHNMDFLKERRTLDVRSYHWVDFLEVPKDLSVSTYLDG